MGAMDFEDWPDNAAPLVMGVVNATPDSFADGGRHVDATAAIAHGRRLAAEGADIVDVGGESTRPGAAPVAADEELRRVVPVVAALAGDGLVVSIDTRNAAVMRAAIDAGAAIVNDVSALTPRCGRAGHRRRDRRRGDPRTHARDARDHAAGAAL